MSTKPMQTPRRRAPAFPADVPSPVSPASVSTPPRLSASAMRRTLPSTARARSSEPTSNEMSPPKPRIWREASA